MNAHAITNAANHVVIESRLERIQNLSPSKVANDYRNELFTIYQDISNVIEVMKRDVKGGLP